MLEPPLDETGLLEAASELSVSRGVEQSPYHHLDTFDHILEVVWGVQRELEEDRLGARVGRDRADGLRLAAALHDVARPVTRGELGAGLVRRVCYWLGLSAPLTGAATTLTALQLKVGFMNGHRIDYPPTGLALAAGGPLGRSSPS